jgi:hypothetical protein
MKERACQESRKCNWDFPNEYFLSSYCTESMQAYVELIKSNIFIKPFLHHQIQKPSLKPQIANNADVEARWLGTTS